MVWIQTTSTLLNIAQAWFGDSIGQRPIPAGNLYAAMLSGKQEFNNVDTSHSVPAGFRTREPVIGMFYIDVISVSFSLWHQVFCFWFYCHLSVSFILQVTRKIFFLCQVWCFSALLTDQSPISWFVSITLWLLLLSFALFYKLVYRTIAVKL